MSDDALAEAGNPITQKLAAISGLQPCGKRVIAPGELVPAPHAAPEPKAEPAPAPKKVRKVAPWTPERRARHRKMMQGLWSDPKFRKKQAKIASARMKAQHKDPKWEARRVEKLKAAFAMKKVGR